MKRIRVGLWLSLLLLGAATATRAETETVFSVEQFLSQVKSGNQGFQAAFTASEGAAKKARQSELVAGTNLFADVQAGSDAKLSTTFFGYDKVLGQSYSLGVQKTTDFGLDAKLYYNVVHTEFVNPVFPNIAGLSGAIPTSFYDSRPILELTQSLWGNGFGKSTRAMEDAVEAQALASGYQSRYQAKNILVAAEQIYWALSLVREKVAVQQKALAQSKKIYEWAAGKAERHLGDESDALQAKAALEVRQLEMQAALDEEATIARAFNKMRNATDVVVVGERLAAVDIDSILANQVPAKAEKRDDVKAAEEQQRAAKAATTIADEKLSPTLDLRGQLALNGRTNQFGSALSDPFNANRPTFTVGLKLVVPLNVGAVSDASEGLWMESKSATLAYEYKLAQQEMDWKDLQKRFDESKRRLELSQKITKAQMAKLDNERERLKQGRATTFQVLQFEQDFSAAQLYEIRAEADVINTVTEMKIYAEAL